MELLLRYALVAIGLTIPSALFAANAPEWLEGVDSATRNARPLEAQQPGREDTTRSADTSPTGPQRGPFLEEYVITGKGVETVDERDASRAQTPSVAPTNGESAVSIMPADEGAAA